MWTLAAEPQVDFDTFFNGESLVQQDASASHLSCTYILPHSLIACCVLQSGLASHSARRGSPDDVSCLNCGQDADFTNLSLYSLLVGARASMMLSPFNWLGEEASRDLRQSFYAKPNADGKGWIVDDHYVRPEICQPPAFRPLELGMTSSVAKK